MAPIVKLELERRMAEVFFRARKNLKRLGVFLIYFKFRPSLLGISLQVSSFLAGFNFGGGDEWLRMPLDVIDSIYRLCLILRLQKMLGIFANRVSDLVIQVYKVAHLVFPSSLILDIQPLLKLFKKIVDSTLGYESEPGIVSEITKIRVAVV